MEWLGHGEKKGLVMIALETKTKLNLFDCTECGGHIALSENLERNMRESHRTFYCPIGHSQFFPALSEAERLRKALHAAELEKTRLAQHARDSQAATDRKAIELAVAQREAARLKKRAVAGVCPCCTRTFAQLARHMKTKHPDHGVQNASLPR
jgi:hypothetical protein